MSANETTRKEIRQLIKTRIANRVRMENLDVPVLPQIAHQVLELTSKPNASANDFVALLEKDQQLSARLLKIANSPVYGGLVKIASLQRAVVTVGMATLRDLVFSVAMNEQIFHSVHFAEPMQRVWEHSLATASIAQEIAREKTLNAEHAFLAGLLHDIGMPLIIETVERLVKQVGTPEIVPPELLDELLRDFHPVVGGLVAKVWRFSDLLYEAIRFHHSYQEADAGREVAHLIGVASDFASSLGLPPYSAMPSDFDIFETPAFRDLHFTQAELRKLLDTLPRLTRELINSFK